VAGLRPNQQSVLDHKCIVLATKELAARTGTISVLNATLFGSNTIEVQSPDFSTFVLAVPEPSSFALAAVGFD
jgi:hypothetical protein